MRGSELYKSLSKARWSNRGRIIPRDISGSPVVVDMAQDPARPPLFVMAKAKTWTLVRGAGPILPYHRPQRPWKLVSFWQHGQPISAAEARAILGEPADPAALRWFPPLVQEPAEAASLTD